MADGHSDALPCSPPPWETLALKDRLDAAKRLFKERKKLAGWIGIAQTFLPQVCDRYRTNGDWQAFYTAVTEKMSKVLGVMDDALREPIPVDWIEFREANAGDLLAIEFKGHQPPTAHEAVWRIGQLMANAYEWCKLTNDEALGKDCEVVNAKTLHDALKSLPFVRNKIEDRLDSELARWQRWLKDEAAKQPPKPVATHGETLASGDDAGGGRGKAVGDETNQGADTPPNNGAHPYRFECKPEIVHVYGFGESAALEKTEGVERLIAIVTKRRVNVMELVRIGVPQQGRDRSSVDVDADRLSERESVNDERFESRLGDDAPSAVREAVRELIEQRDAASDRGDDQGAGELTEQINAALQGGKTAFQAAAGNVRKTLDRTYDRLREGKHGTALAKHFDQYVKRPRGESDYVYAPDEADGKIVWSVK